MKRAIELAKDPRKMMKAKTNFKKRFSGIQHNAVEKLQAEEGARSDAGDHRVGGTPSL